MDYGTDPKGPVSAALIGPGVMGFKYVQMIASGQLPQLRLTAVVARSPQTREKVRAVCGEDVALFDSEEALYAHPEDFEAVIITTPHALHPAMALRALRAGKHILVDKPIGVSLLQCQELLDQAERSDRVFAVVFHQRAYPKYRKVKELLEAGTLGKLYRATMENSRFLRTAFYHRSSPWRSSWRGEGGGALINQGQHLLDMWQWLFGMPQSVSANVSFGKYNDFCVDDEDFLFFRYQNGMTGSFFLTTGEGGRTERLEIAGSKGTLLLDQDRLTLRTYDIDLEDYRRQAQVNAREDLRETTLTWDLPLTEETHAAVLEQFARKIRGEGTLVAEGIQGANAVALMNAAYLSAWQGREVSFPLDGEVYERELEKQRRREEESSI